MDRKLIRRKLIRSIDEEWQISSESQGEIFEIDHSRNLVNHFNIDDPTLEIRNKIWDIVVPELPVQMLDITFEDDGFSWWWLLKFEIKSDDIRFIINKDFCFIFTSRYKKQKSFFLVEDARVIHGDISNICQTYTIRFFEYQIWSKLC